MAFVIIFVIIIAIILIIAAHYDNAKENQKDENLQTIETKKDYEKNKKTEVQKTNNLKQKIITLFNVIKKNKVATCFIILSIVLIVLLSIMVYYLYQIQTSLDKTAHYLYENNSMMENIYDGVNAIEAYVDENNFMIENIYDGVNDLDLYFYKNNLMIKNIQDDVNAIEEHVKEMDRYGFSYY